jgi:hypothetical protein
MPDSLYVIDTTGLSLVELPAVVPNLMIYTLRQQPTNNTSLELMRNFTGEELAILSVQARVWSKDGYSSTTTVALNIVGTVFATVTVPVVSADSTSFAPLWTADPEAPTLLGATQSLGATAAGAWDSTAAAVDICMIPSSQLSLLGS